MLRFQLKHPTTFEAVYREQMTLTLLWPTTEERLKLGAAVDMKDQATYPDFIDHIARNVWVGFKGEIGDEEGNAIPDTPENRKALLQVSDELFNFIVQSILNTKGEEDEGKDASGPA